jgi:DNA-binding LytR/AlgR family response regulator
MLSVLAVDDELPSLDELSFLLRSCDLVGPVTLAHNATEALKCLRADRFDVVLLDIRMPGLDGLDLARVLGRFSQPPAVVFVTAHEEHALEAFDVGAVGYLLKPVQRERLEQLLRRTVGTDIADIDTVAVELAGHMVLVARQDISWVEAAGDYVRLHLREGQSYLYRIPLSVLEADWRGFVRIHRSYLVALQDIQELWTEDAHTYVKVAGTALPVSRRHLHELRDRLVGHARPHTR